MMSSEAAAEVEYRPFARTSARGPRIRQAQVATAAASSILSNTDALMTAFLWPEATVWRAHSSSLISHVGRQ